ncbi:MAG: hypothetical protein K9W45_13120 [Candidatus Heimdallarchaeum aukensis]|uniref:Uncharacterized protein n=1 Tax=Candidatus Heimdallarchaeum aukensis TaxID=2876573 RepID=A0A9Y1BKL5_9ARCH|nr:MAG: hypothetical protein K9W45_13120 [Candidatus Heimdallarchaeum aukensis]
MAKKANIAKWGRILALIGGILWVALGVLMLLGDILSSIVSLFTSLSLGGNLANAIIAAIILIAVGAITILISLGRFGLKELVTGIIFIILGIIGGGLVAILVLIAGILLVIAGL